MTTQADERVPEIVTRADLEEAIVNHRNTLRRMPDHWTDRRASLHAKIDGLLDQWEQAPV